MGILPSKENIIKRTIVVENKSFLENFADMKQIYFKIEKINEDFEIFVHNKKIIYTDLDNLIKYLKRLTRLLKITYDNDKITYINNFFREVDIFINLEEFEKTKNILISYEKFTLNLTSEKKIIH